MSTFDQVLTTLNLCASDTREDAFKSIIKTTLFEIGEPLTVHELVNWIKEIYGFEPHKEELKSVIEILDDLGEVVQSGNKLSISQGETINLQLLEKTSRTEEQKRFENFKQFLSKKYSVLPSEQDFETCWKIFLEYFYQCFFIYGERANSVVNPRYLNEDSQKVNNTDILYGILTEYSRLDLAEILKYAIDNFSDFATSDDIDFIDALGQKTLSFSSLGLDPATIDTGFEQGLIDWVLFLDTNFLFSILDLHINVEDDACKELLKLFLNNPDYIKVKLYYTDLTLRELKHKKDDFREIEDNLSRPAIKALLKSDELDQFSQRYYEGLLKNPDVTLHPSKIVDIADTTLKAKRIDIFSTNPQRKILNEEYIGVKIVEYQRFINDLNERRREYYQYKKIGRPPREVFRSESQKEHDITLREILSLLRSAVKKKNEFKTLNQAKYFGVTLDELLIRYDNFDLRQKGSDEYPLFFKPSYLLNKFIKILPVKTDNYKKAFIKAVSSRGFYKDSKRSNDVIKIVSYLREQGVDNEALLLNLITEKVFLEKYKEESSQVGFDQKEFFETEINRLYQSKEEELQSTKVELDRMNELKTANESEKSKLIHTKNEAEAKLSLYEIMIDKLKNKVTTLETKLGQQIVTPVLNFEPEKAELLWKKLEEEQLKRMSLENEVRKEKRRRYISKKMLRWQLKALVPFIITLSLFFLYIGRLYLSHNAEDGQSFLDSIRNNPTISVTSSVVALFLNLFIGKLVYDRFFNESFKKVYKENIEVPVQLREILKIDEIP